MAYLVLEDGTCFAGRIAGAEIEDIRLVGEVVFNNSMAGFQELITDPSMSGLTAVLTFPLIGNCGANEEDFESDKVQTEALVINGLCDFPNNFRMTMTFEEFLKKQNIPAIVDVDTRKLTRYLREHGTQRGAIIMDKSLSEKAVDEIRRGENPQRSAYTAQKNVYKSNESKYNIALCDIGTSRSIINELNKMGFDLTVYPLNESPEIPYKHDGIIISGGIETGTETDPSDNLVTIKKLMNSGLPVFGIGFGHILMAKASGAEIKKMKNGHRGDSHPVREIKTGQIHIVSQNHGYVAQGVSEVLYESVNDGVPDGFNYDNNCFSVQFKPLKQDYERFLRSLCEKKTDASDISKKK